VRCGLYAPGLHRVLEYDGAHVGLPLSWLAIYERRKTAQWTCAGSSCQEPLMETLRRWRQQVGSKRHHSERSSPKFQPPQVVNTDKAYQCSACSMARSPVHYF
jgi:hypothetical protein